MSAEEVERDDVVYHVKLLHKFLPPTEVELRVAFGGTDDQRLLVMLVRCLGDSSPMMVVDHKGRICYANSQLSSMLGYNAKVLSTLELNAIIPLPFAQMHTNWIKVRRVGWCTWGCDTTSQLNVECGQLIRAAC
jgi:PAS domain-containing protein